MQISLSVNVESFNFHYIVRVSICIFSEMVSAVDLHLLCVFLDSHEDHIDDHLETITANIEKWPY